MAKVNVRPLGDRVLVQTFGGNFGRDEGAGWYPFLEIVATDTLSNKTVSKSVDFTVKPPVETKTAAANAAPGGR